MSEKIYGIHAVEAALNDERIQLIEIVISDSRQDQVLTRLLNKAKERKVQIKQVPRKDLDRLLRDINHQGIMAVVEYTQRQYDEMDVLSWIDEPHPPVLLLILDGVQDPHNLGACLRTAEAAGVTAVIAPKDKSVSLTPTVRKVACGAAEQIPFIQVTNLARFLKQIKDRGVWCYGLAGEAEKSVYDLTFSGHLALVLGAEGTGLRQLTRESCDMLLSIPMQGKINSLNVSVATGIGLFEIVRQRRAQ
jgi:23S rRNA (guanosine2251-2'-O)-methyltransferase